MTIRRPALTICGTLLTALLISTAYAVAQTSTLRLRTLHNFTGGSDGASPVAAMVIGKGGVLYGTTLNGGSSGYGTVFSMTPPASPGGSWVETVLHEFTGGSDGAYPYGGMVPGSGGVLYGSTDGGGASGDGTVFSLTPPAAPGGSWTETVLYSFTGVSDGATPYAGVAISKGGVLYGTTYYGGKNYYGVVFSLTPPASPSGSWTETVLHNFSAGSDGAHPFAGVAIGSGGVLYGTTEGGGTSNLGTVFKLRPPRSPGGAWTEQVLYNFAGAPSDGAFPFAGVTIGSGGVLYGATYFGGSGPCTTPSYPPGCGMVFSLTPPTSPGGSWTEAVLRNFTGGDGATPGSKFVIGSGAVLYGTTQSGGTSGGGTVFSLTPPVSPGGSWTETVLHNFTCRSDGCYPYDSVVIKGGVLYGTTQYGGRAGSYGTVFALKP
jgi:uncharacterized repeat protein (TIGR03803 family)